jgi:hypothetical protein
MEGAESSSGKGSKIWAQNFCFSRGPGLNRFGPRIVPQPAERIARVRIEAMTRDEDFVTEELSQIRIRPLPLFPQSADCSCWHGVTEGELHKA